MSSTSHGASASSEPSFWRKAGNLTGLAYDKKLDAKLRHGSEAKQAQKFSADIDKLSEVLGKDYKLVNPLNPLEQSLRFKAQAFVSNLSKYAEELEENEKNPLSPPTPAALQTKISDELDKIITDAEWDNKLRSSPAGKSVKEIANDAKIGIASLKSADLKKVIKTISEAGKFGIHRADLQPNEVAGDSEEGKALSALQKEIDEIVGQIQSSEYLQHAEGHEKIQQLAKDAKGAVGHLITKDPAKNGAIVLKNVPAEIKKLTDLRDALHNYLTTPDTKVDLHTWSIRYMIWSKVRTALTIVGLGAGAGGVELTTGVPTLTKPLEAIGVLESPKFPELEAMNLEQLKAERAKTKVDNQLSPKFKNRKMEEIDERIQKFEEEYRSLNELKIDELQALEKQEIEKLQNPSANVVERLKEKIGKIQEKIRGLTVAKSGEAPESQKETPEVELAPGYKAKRVGSKKIVITKTIAVSQFQLRGGVMGSGKAKDLNPEETGNVYTLTLSDEEAASPKDFVIYILTRERPSDSWKEGPNVYLRKP